MMSSSEEESVAGSEEVSVEEESGGEEEVESEEEQVPVKGKRGRGKKADAKDPNKPKRNQSSFFLYSNANRARIREENPDTPFGQIAKLLSAEFKSLDRQERAKWDNLAKEDKKRYDAEMGDYEPSAGGGKKGKKQKKDPNKPKRNMSAYFLYSNAHRASIKERNPDASFGELAKLISEEFKALPAKERKKWDAKAAADKERYQEEMRAYNGA